MVASIMVAKSTPTSIGTTSWISPIRYGIPMGRIRLFAAEKVAPEIDVCTRFCEWIFLYFLNIASGILERIIAKSAPTMDVFVLIPTRTISSIPMIAPRTASIIFRIKIAGLNANGCFCPCVPLFCSFIKTPPLC